MIAPSDYGDLKTDRPGIDERISALGTPLEATYNETHGEYKPDDYQAACRLHGVPPVVHEAHEHWVVTDWFATHLRGRHEIVAEFFGLTIWGRCTTGQAIKMDHVIPDIAKQIAVLPGQEYEWTD